MGFRYGTANIRDYDMAGTPYGKGIVGSLADECKKQGIDFGIYYSICDWRHEDYPVEYPDQNTSSILKKTLTMPRLRRKWTGIYYL